MAVRACVVAFAVLAVAAPAGGAPGNGKIAFFRDWFFGPLFIANIDGSGEIRVPLASGPAPAVWSPDGSHLAYLDGGSPMVVGADGTLTIRYPHRPGSTISCWLDASTFVVTASSDLYTYDLYTYSLDGTVRQLTQDGGFKSVSAQGCSPDGQAVAYRAAGKAFVLALDGSAPRQITTPGFGGTTPAWSPDGKKLAFARDGPMSSDSGPTRSDLVVVDTAGSDASSLTGLTSRVQLPELDAGIRWSPDSRRILFTRWYADDRHCDRYSGCQIVHQVLTIDADGSHERVLAEGPHDFPQAWSPDGTRIAFTSGQSSVVMNADGTCQKALPASVGNQFSWQPVPGKDAEPQTSCVDLRVSASREILDLPMSGRGSYVITVTNRGNLEAKAATLEQRGRLGVTFRVVRTSQGACVDGNDLYCNLGSLAAGATAKIVASVRFWGINAGTYPASVSAENEWDPGDNTASISFTVFDHCTIVGSVQADRVIGTRRRDLICARSGDDWIDGKAGADRIHGGLGADAIDGGRGRDVIRGGGGDDEVFARDGERDVVDCGPQKDIAVVDRRDVVSNCEVVHRPKARSRTAVVSQGSA